MGIVASKRKRKVKRSNDQQRLWREIDLERCQTYVKLHSFERYADETFRECMRRLEGLIEVSNRCWPSNTWEVRREAIIRAKLWNIVSPPAQIAFDVMSAEARKKGKEVSVSKLLLEAELHELANGHQY
jgi:hypothetical protein